MKDSLLKVKNIIILQVLDHAKNNPKQIFWGCTDDFNVNSNNCL